MTTKKKTQKKTYKAPFLNGDLVGFVETWTTTRPGFEWREVEPFYAELSFVDMYSGRSAKGFTLTDSDGHEYSMFVKDVLDFLQRVQNYDGTACGYWEVCKRGANYGIRYLGRGSHDHLRVVPAAGA